MERSVAWSSGYEPPAETPLDAQVPGGDGVVERRGRLDDLAVLHVQGECAADAAVRADRIGRGLPRGVPGAGLPQFVFAARHQRAGGTHRDAVAAVDARGIRQRDVELGRDARAEAAAGDGDGERVLMIGTAGLHALVAEDALAVIADVEIVVDLDRLRDRRG